MRHRIASNFDPPFPNTPAFKAVTLAADSEFAASFRPRVVSTSVALTWVATGQRAAYITDGDVRDSVHFAAGLAICEAAGCTVTDLRGRAWGSGTTGLVAAADSETHAAILYLVRKYLVGNRAVQSPTSACSRPLRASGFVQKGRPPVRELLSHNDSGPVQFWTFP